MLTTLVVGGGPTGTEFAGEVRPPPPALPPGSSTGAGAQGGARAGACPALSEGCRCLEARCGDGPPYGRLAAFDCRRWLCRLRTF